jgi:hypothetical protein
VTDLDASVDQGKPDSEYCWAGLSLVGHPTTRKSVWWSSLGLSEALQDLVEYWMSGQEGVLQSAYHWDQAPST